MNNKNNDPSDEEVYKSFSNHSKENYFEKNEFISPKKDNHDLNILDEEPVHAFQLNKQKTPIFSNIHHSEIKKRNQRDESLNESDEEFDEPDDVGELHQPADSLKKNNQNHPIQKVESDKFKDPTANHGVSGAANEFFPRTTPGIPHSLSHIPRNAEKIKPDYFFQDEISDSHKNDAFQIENEKNKHLKNIKYRDAQLHPHNQKKKKAFYLNEQDKNCDLLELSYQGNGSPSHQKERHSSAHVVDFIGLNEKAYSPKKHAMKFVNDQNIPKIKQLPSKNQFHNDDFNILEEDQSPYHFEEDNQIHSDDQPIKINKKHSQDFLMNIDNDDEFSDLVNGKLQKNHHSDKQHFENLHSADKKLNQNLYSHSLKPNQNLYQKEDLNNKTEKHSNNENQAIKKGRNNEDEILIFTTMETFPEQNAKTKTIQPNKFREFQHLEENSIEFQQNDSKKPMEFGNSEFKTGLKNLVELNKNTKLSDFKELTVEEFIGDSPQKNSDDDGFNNSDQLDEWNSQKIGLKPKNVGILKVEDFSNEQVGEALENSFDKAVDPYQSINKSRIEKHNAIPIPNQFQVPFDLQTKQQNVNKEKQKNNYQLEIDEKHKHSKLITQNATSEFSTIKELSLDQKTNQTRNSQSPEQVFVSDDIYSSTENGSNKPIIKIQKSDSNDINFVEIEDSDNEKPNTHKPSTESKKLGFIHLEKSTEENVVLLNYENLSFFQSTAQINVNIQFSKGIPKLTYYSVYGSLFQENDITGSNILANFHDFEDLHMLLSENFYYKVLPSLPNKFKLLKIDEESHIDRAVSLKNYLDCLFKIDGVSHHPILVNFLINQKEFEKSRNQLKFPIFKIGQGFFEKGWSTITNLVKLVKQSDDQFDEGYYNQFSKEIDSLYLFVKNNIENFEKLNSNMKIIYKNMQKIKEQMIIVEEKKEKSNVQKELLFSKVSSGVFRDTNGENKLDETVKKLMLIFLEICSCKESLERKDIILRTYQNLHSQMKAVGMKNKDELQREKIKQEMNFWREKSENMKKHLKQELSVKIREILQSVSQLVRVDIKQALVNLYKFETMTDNSLN